MDFVLIKAFAVYSQTALSVPEELSIELELYAAVDTHYTSSFILEIHSTVFQFFYTVSYAS